MTIPTLIVMTGLQGSGKSSIAYSLSKKLKIPVLSVDPIHSAILKAGISDSFEVGLADYLVVERLAEENLKNGISVIIDASNYVNQAHEIWENLAERVNVPLKVIECKVDEEVHKPRVENRTREITGVKDASWEDVQKRKDEMAVWNIDKLTINTELDIEENVEKIVEYMDVNIDHKS